MTDAERVAILRRAIASVLSDGSLRSDKSGILRRALRATDEE